MPRIKHIFISGCNQSPEKNSLQAWKAIPIKDRLLLMNMANSSKAKDRFLDVIKAMLYAAQTLKGAAQMLIETGEHPGKLKDAVCSPAGSTIEGVKALENGAFRASAMDAVRKAYERTLELGK